MSYDNYNTFSNDIINRIIIPLGNFTAYINEMEKSFLDKYIANIEDEENDNYEHEKDEEEEEEDSHLMQRVMFFTSDRYRYSIEFPNILRTSVFLSLYSFLENQLVVLCKQIQSRKRISLSVNDLNDSGIEKASKYLKKVVGIDFPDNTKEWTYIKQCNQLRNCIVHNGGIVNEENKKLLNAIATIPSVKAEYNLLEKGIKLEKEFCLDFIMNIESLWKQLGNEYLSVLYPFPYY